MEQEQNEDRIYTSEDVAKALGVSKSTVSRAISGKGRISAATRARVMAFIEEHNYRPNAVAKSLASNRTYNLGLVIPGGGGVDMAFFRECMQGICLEAARQDYDVLVAVDDNGETGQLRRILNNHKVDGVIATRGEINSPVTELLKARHIPFVLVGAGYGQDVLYVDNDNRGACRDLTARLIAGGVRRMTLLGGDENFCVTHSRLSGFRDACLQAGLPWEEQLVVLNVTDSAAVAAAIQQGLERKLDTLICMDDFICSMALSQLRARHLRIPEDVRLACFYDSSLLEQTTPPVTSLRFDAAQLGQAACRILLDLLAGETAESRVLPDYRMMLRGSAE